MAKSKSKSVVLRLMSQAGTGYYYTFRTVLKGVREKCERPPAAFATSCSRIAARAQAAAHEV